jgi:hypothetical protein
VPTPQGWAEQQLKDAPQVCELVVELPLAVGGLAGEQDPFELAGVQVDQGAPPRRGAARWYTWQQYALKERWARPSICCRVRAAWRRSFAAASWGPGSAGRACRWTSGSVRTSRPGSGTRSGSRTSTVSGPADASTKHTLARWGTHPSTG